MFNSFFFLAALASSPNEAVFKLYEGNRLLNEGKTEQAASLVKPLHFYPHQPLKKFQTILKARTLLLSSPEEAIALLQSAELDSSPWNDGVKYAESWGWILKGDREAALELLQQMPSNPKLHLLKAKLFLALDLPNEGLSLLEALDPETEESNDPSELLVVKALLFREKGETEQAIEILQTSENEGVTGFYRDYLLLVLGKLQFEQGRDLEAFKQWNVLLQQFPLSPYRPEALYWIARAQENSKGNPKEVSSIHRELITKYPDFPFADEVYFNQYSFQDYLHGDREAVKHLDKLSTLHPKSPLTIVAFYLIGLDKQQDRRSLEGKSIRKKNIMDAIAAFESAQKNFETIKPEDPYYLHVKNLAALERGKLLSQVSTESPEPKKAIYRHYAIDVLTPLLEEDREISSQAALQLASLAMASQEFEEAKHLVMTELNKWGGSSCTATAFLTIQLGQVFHDQGEYETALRHFIKAEDLGAKGILNHDQELDLWIRQALCHQEMGQYDQAMLLFSRAINRNVVSSQRLRAMYLRAEVYRRQGREELAKKQWEAVALKGGEWAQRAKEKLESGE